MKIHFYNEVWTIKIKKRIQIILYDIKVTDDYRLDINIFYIN